MRPMHYAEEYSKHDRPRFFKESPKTGRMFVSLSGKRHFAGQKDARVAKAFKNEGWINGLARTTANVVDIVDVWMARHLNRAPRHLPVLVLMVTDKCNLHCKMCGACDYSPGDHNMLSLEDWKAVIDSAAKLRTQIVSITGGEALLRRDLFDIIRHARGYGMAVHLNTNGLLLRDKNVATLKEVGVETVSISIESTDPDIHDAIRGRGAFASTLKGVRKLRAAAPEIRIGLNSVMNRHNLDTLPDMVAFAQREGLEQVKFAPIHSNLQHKDKPVDDYADMVFGAEDLPHFEKRVAEIQAALDGTNLESCSEPFFEGMSDLYRPPASNFYCYAGYAITIIDAQGNVAACFDKEGAMNVRETPLHDIWRSRTFQEHRQLVRHCDQACWDTTNAELSLRLSFTQMLRRPAATYRAIRYYMAQGRKKRNTMTPGGAATKA